MNGNGFPHCREPKCSLLQSRKDISAGRSFNGSAGNDSAGAGEEMEYLIIAVTSLVAGTVQLFTGFGTGVVMMAVLPYFYGIIISPGISQIICFGLVVIMLIRRRKSIRFRQILLPTVLFSLSGVIIIHLVPSFDRRILTIAFGVFLIAISLYSFLSPSGIRISESVPKTVAVSTVSGMLSGMFGVGGPLMATYLVSVTDEY